MRIPQLFVFVSSCALCASALSQPPRRVQLDFSGTTSASQPLIQDVMMSVMEIGDEELGCEKPDSVLAEALPEGVQRVDPQAAPEGAKRTVQERWTVDLCGREVPFVLTFWTLEQGGTAFDLDYPNLDTLATTRAGGVKRLSSQ